MNPGGIAPAPPPPPSASITYGACAAPAPVTLIPAPATIVQVHVPEQLQRATVFTFPGSHGLGSAPHWLWRWPSITGRLPRPRPGRRVVLVADLQRLPLVTGVGNQGQVAAGGLL